MVCSHERLGVIHLCFRKTGCQLQEWGCAAYLDALIFCMEEGQVLFDRIICPRFSRPEDTVPLIYVRVDAKFILGHLRTETTFKVANSVDKITF